VDLSKLSDLEAAKAMSKTFTKANNGKGNHIGATSSYKTKSDLVSTRVPRQVQPASLFARAKSQDPRTSAAVIGHRGPKLRALKSFAASPR
jgi:hypothetical protein